MGSCTKPCIRQEFSIANLRQTCWRAAAPGQTLRQPDLRESQEGLGRITSARAACVAWSLASACASWASARSRLARMPSSSCACALRLASDSASTACRRAQALRTPISCCPAGHTCCSPLKESIHLKVTACMHCRHINTTMSWPCQQLRTEFPPMLRKLPSSRGWQCRPGFYAYHMRV